MWQEVEKNTFDWKGLFYNFLHLSKNNHHHQCELREENKMRTFIADVTFLTNLPFILSMLLVILSSKSMKVWWCLYDVCYHCLIIFPYSNQYGRYLWCLADFITNALIKYFPIALMISYIYAKMWLAIKGIIIWNAFYPTPQAHFYVAMKMWWR